MPSLRVVRRFLASPVKNRLRVLLSLGALALACCKPRQDARDSIASSTPAPQAAAATPADAEASRVAARIRKIVAEQLKLSPDRVLLTSTWQELGADSLDTVELVMAFEEEFHGEISDERAMEMKTVGDVVSFLAQSSPL